MCVCVCVCVCACAHVCMYHCACVYVPLCMCVAVNCFISAQRLDQFSPCFPSPIQLFTKLFFSRNC